MSNSFYQGYSRQIDTGSDLEPNDAETEYIVHHEDDEQPKHKSKGDEELGGQIQEEEHVRQRQTDRQIKLGEYRGRQRLTDRQTDRQIE